MIGPVRGRRVGGGGAGCESETSGRSWRREGGVFLEEVVLGSFDGEGGSSRGVSRMLRVVRARLLVVVETRSVGLMSVGGRGTRRRGLERRCGWIGRETEGREVDVRESLKVWNGSLSRRSVVVETRRRSCLVLGGGGRR